MVVVGSFLVLQSLMVVDPSHSVPFSPVPQACIGTWPLLCWQDWRGGSKATSNCPGKTSSLLTSLLSRRGRGQSRHTPCQGPIHLPVSTFLPHPRFSSRPKQAQAPRPGGRAVLTLRKVREPSKLEAGSPEAGPEASIRGHCPAWSPFIPLLRSLALCQKNWASQPSRRGPCLLHLSGLLSQ